MSETARPTAASLPLQVVKAPAPDASKAMTLFVMIVATLYFGKEVLVPITLAMLLAFILAPLVDLLRRGHFGRIPSVLVGVTMALGVVVSLGAVIGSQLSELSEGIPGYATAVEAKVTAVRSYTVGRLSHVMDEVSPHKQQQPVPHPDSAAARGPQPEQPAPAAPVQPAASPMALVRTYLSTALAPVETTGIVFVVAVFILIQREDLRDRMIRLVGSDDLHRTTLAMDDAGHRLSRYFLTQMCVNMAFGLVVGTGLYFIGVPNPVLWGILSALLRFVPYIGSLIAAGLPMALAAAASPGWSMVAWTAGLYAAVEGLTGQVMEPLLYGHSTGLSPFSVIVAAIFWSWLWGPIGLILSTPLTLCLVVMGRHVDRLGFLEVLLGDSPALTPVESFYQRILAGDADEAQDQAEILLKERSLSTYYDEVALKGLQMAATDAQRGALDSEQMERVRATAKALVAGLSRHEDVQPPAVPGPLDGDGVLPDEEAVGVPQKPVPPSLPAAREDPLPEWRAKGAVLCIAGRGPLDETASSMLAQLLGKHGMHARTVSHGEVSRDGIGTLDATGAVMACISYLDISGNPAHLRYLMQRLRARLPQGARILVGMWPAGDGARQDGDVERTIGADLYAGSLTEAVAACIEAATA